MLTLIPALSLAFALSAQATPDVAAPDVLIRPLALPSAELLASLAPTSLVPAAPTSDCKGAEVHLVEGGARAGAPIGKQDLMYRDTDGVQGALLLERQVNGCSVPIQTRYDGPFTRGDETTEPGAHRP
jgi:hypothetical protein